MNNNINKLISIVIPYHNEGHEYIKKLLRSLDDQIGVQWSFVEIIISNNCENPNNGEIPFSEYPNVENVLKFVYPSTKNNIGLSRQCGVDNACGKYIMYCDSDDIIYTADTLYKLLSLCNDRNDDIIYLQHIIETKIVDQYDNEVGSLIRPAKEIPMYRRDSFIHDKLYKREFLNKYNIRFCDKIRYDEDGYYNILTYLLSDTIAECELSTYLMIGNVHSISREKNTQFQELIPEQIALAQYYGFKYVNSIINLNNLNQSVVFELFYNIAYQLYVTLELTYCTEESYLSKLYAETLLARNIIEFDSTLSHLNIEQHRNIEGKETFVDFLSRIINSYNPLLIDTIIERNNPEKIQDRILKR